MSWSMIEGTELTPDWQGVANDPDRVSGGVLCWNDEPVRLPGDPKFNSWSTPWGARHHITVLEFENGWIGELRLSGEAPDDVAANGVPILYPGGLTLGGSNQRAIAERQDREEKGEVDMFVGDEWDYSYLKTGYQWPGAYIQWNFSLYRDPDVTDPAILAKINELEDNQWADVPDKDELVKRLQIIAEQPSDPYEAAARTMAPFEKSTNA